MAVEFYGDDYNFTFFQNNCILRVLSHKEVPELSNFTQAGKIQCGEYFLT